MAGTGATLTVVPADTAHFQIDFDAFERALNPRVAAVLINTPNNPSGAVYSEQTLRRLAQILEERGREWGHAIFLISDEPYREIVFGGAEQPYPARFYANTPVSASGTWRSIRAPSTPSSWCRCSRRSAARSGTTARRRACSSPWRA